MWQQAVAAFEQASLINRSTPLRRGSVIHLPPGAHVILAGDLHGHSRNLARIESLAGGLAARPDRHVILQELIHDSSEFRIPNSAFPIPSSELPPADLSHRLLTRVARWQVAFPAQVHVILGNHELAELTGQDILKSGASASRAFTDSIRNDYGPHADEVLCAMHDYFASLPLAARTDGGLAAVHSLPADRVIATFDATVFARGIQPADRDRSGPACQLVWGRSFGRASIERIRQALGARVLVLGHQPQPAGLRIVDDDVLIIASDHEAGVVLSIPPGPVRTAADLAARAVRLAAHPCDALGTGNDEFRMTNDEGMTKPE